MVKKRMFVLGAVLLCTGVLIAATSPQSSPQMPAKGLDKVTPVAAEKEVASKPSVVDTTNMAPAGQKFTRAARPASGGLRGDCVLDCEPNEGEEVCYDGYDDTFNAGCNNPAEPFGTIVCGEPICGTSGVYLFNGTNYRDMEWYRYTVTTPTVFTWAGVAEFPVAMWVISGPCSALVVEEFANDLVADPCYEVSLTTGCLDPGEYTFIIAPADWGAYPCGVKWEATLTCGPCLGACCDDATGDCVEDAAAEDCPPPLRFALATACADLLPPCGGCDEDDITIEILTDNYGSETSWELIDANTGTIVMSVAPGTLASNTFYTWTWCAPYGNCYNFFIHDSFGDGICCAYGNGYYNVLYNGALECTGGDFDTDDQCVLIGDACEDALGACCDDDTGVCNDGVAEPDCQPPLRFEAFTLCADLDPPCGGYPVDFEVVAPYEGPTDPMRTTCGAGNDCALRTSEEHTYKVTIPYDGEWIFSLCGSTYDTYMFLGTAPCTGDIAANDDFCGLQSQIQAVLTAGDYYVDVEGYSGCGDYVLNVWEFIVDGACCNEDTGDCADNVLEEDCPAGYRWEALTLCADLVPPCGTVLEPDFVVTAPYAGPMDPMRTTCGAGNDCVLGISSEDHLYEVAIPEDGDWIFSLCGSLYDTYIYVGTTLCGAEVGQNDDFCGLQSQLTATLTAGTYYVAVEGFSSNCGEYVLNVYQPVPCEITCEDNSGEEICYDEYDDTYNSGCNNPAEPFQDIFCGDTICGASGVFPFGGSTYRDMDWYHLTLAEAQSITWEATAEFPLAMWIASGPCSALSVILFANDLDADPVDGCYDVSLTTEPLAADTYTLIISTADWGAYPCGVKYEANLSCFGVPHGACCFDFEPILCGDLDHDGDIDIDDYWLFVDAYGTSLGDEKYNAEADYDQSGQINLLDYFLWIQCYEAEEPPIVGYGLCLEDVAEPDCEAMGGRFAMDTLCADLVPACGAITGACCFGDGSCVEDVIWFECEPPAVFVPGGTCADCPDCILGCVPNEGEVTCYDGYDDTFNSGCNNPAEPFGQIACGQTICGTSGVFAFGGSTYRDMEWYQVELDAPGILTWAGEAEFPLAMWILSGNCASLVVEEFASDTVADPCYEVSLTSACLDPGVYIVLLSTADWGAYPCGVKWEATLTCSTCEIFGACCNDDIPECADNVSSLDCLPPLRFAANTLCADLTPPCGGCPESEVTIDILTDNYGGETSWDLLDHDTGAVIAQVTGGLSSNTQYSWTVCVPADGCFDWYIYDSFGDGICCDYGIGVYSVYLDGGLVCTGGEFGAQDSCLNFGSGCNPAAVKDIWGQQVQKPLKQVKVQSPDAVTNKKLVVPGSTSNVTR